MRAYRFFVSLLFFFLAAQAATAGDVIKVCCQTLQNFFYSLDRERTTKNGVPVSNYTTAEGRQAKANAIVNELSPYAADIYAFNEVEARPSSSDTEALDLLAAEMSKATGISYSVVADGLSYDLDSDATGLIKSGFIYRPDKVVPVGDNVSTAVGYTIIYPYMMRMQTFMSVASGEQFTLSMNHFKASTSGDMEEDAEKREQNSIALLKGLDLASDPDILVLGDLNSVMGEQCLNNLVDAGYEEQIIKWEGAGAYSYWYDGGSLIDHVFANSTMAAQVSDARIEYVANKHSVGNNAYSDHDPYLITLNLNSQPAAKYGFKKATSFSTGVRYLFVVPVNGLQVADHIPTPGKYYGNHSFISVNTRGQKLE